MRRKIYDIISSEESRAGTLYDWIMVVSIIISIIPLAMKDPPAYFDIVDKVCVTIFIIDYILRLITADYKYNKKGASSFVKYPLRPMSIIDLLSIIPSFIPISQSANLLKLFRLFRTARAIRAFKLFRYSKNALIIAKVLRKQKNALTYVAVLALSYILIAALIIYNIEPETFDTFFDALYWATVSFTTVGYGDIYPVTDIGRFIAMLSSLFGIAVIALPAGIITAGYMSEIQKNDKEDKDTKNKNHKNK